MLLPAGQLALALATAPQQSALRSLAIVNYAARKPRGDNAVLTGLDTASVILLASFAPPQAAPPRLSLSFFDPWAQEEIDPANGNNTAQQMRRAFGMLPRYVRRRVRLANFDSSDGTSPTLEEVCDGVPRGGWASRGGGGRVIIRRFIGRQPARRRRLRRP